MASSREVTIGDRTVRIEAFRGFKALEIARLVAAIGEQVPDIQNKLVEFTSTYEELNTVKITPGMAVLPRYAGLGLTEDHFARSGGVVEVPLSPATWEQVAAVFPEAFGAARGEVVKLLALIAAPNSDLRKWDDEDSVDDELEKLGKDLLHDADFDQYVDLLIAAIEVITEQFKGKADVVGKIAGLWQGRPQSNQQTRATPKPPKSKKRGSSPASPEPSGGEDEKPSTVPAGAS